jgi:hypothetical protein
MALAAKRRSAGRAWWLGLAVALLGCLQVLGGWSARWHEHDGLGRHVHWTPELAAGLEGAPQGQLGSAPRCAAPAAPTQEIDGVELRREALSVQLPELLLAPGLPEPLGVPPASEAFELPQSLWIEAPGCEFLAWVLTQSVWPPGGGAPEPCGTGAGRLIARGGGLRL